jgi:hypothetical protein
MREFSVLISSKSLGNVSRDRTGGITDLIAKFEIVMRLSLASNCVHPFAKSVRKAPNMEIFES